MRVAEIKDLCKDYPAFHLRKVSFTIEKGRIAGFIGRNGAGKTTTIKSMLNLVHPDNGEITFFRHASGQARDGHQAALRLFHRDRQLVSAQEIEGHRQRRQTVL